MKQQFSEERANRSETLIDNYQERYQSPKHAVSGSGLVLVLALIIMISCAGCSAGWGGHTHVIEYDVERPDLIEEAGIRDLPEEIRGRRSDTLERCGDSVWFGIKNFGLASYDLNEGTWKLAPAGQKREFIASDIEWPRVLD